MKFKPTPKQKHSDLEKDIIKYWKKNHTFQKSIDQRPEDNSFRFDDGPPFITGLPHHGHLLVSTIKDSVARYQTMQGKRVERAWGWDCHGLPAEVKTEEKLGIKSRSEIGTKISIEDYVNTCREAMVQGSKAWDNVVDRIGRWVDMTSSYKTMDKEYMESVWWAFKTLYEGGKIYDGEKVLVYCPRDATPISKSEVAMENSYKLTTDPSLFVYFKLADESKFKNTYLLAWTTTPWTLPANTGLAVNPALKYVLVEHNGKKLILAKNLVEGVFKNAKNEPLDYTVLEDFDINQLLEQHYEPLFVSHGQKAHRVVPADFVTDADGTGVVHIAPAYGEDDFDLGKQNNLPVVSVVDENGVFSSGPWQGEHIWEINKEIAKSLVSDGVALRVEYITHEYPHCHRCGTKLMYRAHESWFMDIQAQKDEMLAANSKVNWVPEHLREGRFKNILETAPDWNISRDRFWATPIPVWKGQSKDGTEVIKVFGSFEEFYESTGKKQDDYHLPTVMDVTFELDGVTMRHIGKVLDCWFESGCVPFAQFHYPFENKAKFEDSFPADFICEAVDQTRGWFYSMMAVNIGLFDMAPYKNVITAGFLNATDGQKLSKKLNNYTEPTELMDMLSADAERLHFLTSPLVNGEDASLTNKEVEVVERKLAMFSNTLDFFVMYASVDGWDSKVAWDNEELVLPKSKNILDLWIVSKLQTLIKEVQTGADTYRLHEATRGIIPFLDDLSNWYVRRSRKRFWKSENDDDKNHAYHTLYYVLVQFSKVLAPFSPFMSEDIFRKLTSNESVHLEFFPQHEPSLVHSELEEQMASVRESVREGLAERARAGVKVRQPLSSASIPKVSKELAEIAAEELNVQKVNFGDEVKLDLDITPALKVEGLAREIVRTVQSARKNAGLNVDDRIALNLQTDSKELQEAISKFKKDIESETLTGSWSAKSLTYSEVVKIENQELTLGLQKHTPKQ